jgi:N-methylhydantoinase A
VLGLLDPDNAIGKGRGAGMDPELARAAIGETIAVPLGLNPEEAAEAILTVTGAKMAGHIRRKLLERGLDPRGFSLVAFGGAGPLHANRILREVGLARAVIPYYPGITSAMGCVLGQLRHDFMRTVFKREDALDEIELEAIYAEQAEEATSVLREEGVAAADIRFQRSADMCYRGQSNLIPVALPPGEKMTWPVIRAAFLQAYQARYGRSLDGADVVLVNARTTAESATEPPSLASLIRLPEGPLPEPRRAPIYLGGRRVEASVYARLELPRGARVEGPALLLQPDTTCFVEPGYAATVHPTGNILIETAP